MAEQSHTSRTIRCKGGRANGRAKYLAHEPNVTVVDDVKTLTQGVEGQDDMQVVTGIKVTHYTKTEVPVDTLEVTPLVDMEMIPPTNVNVNALDDTEVIAPASLESCVHTNEGILGGSGDHPNLTG